MPSEQYRKFLITIQNPGDRGYTHENIRDIVGSLNADYACMADEISSTGTLHTHVFIYRKSPIRKDTIRRKFPSVHIDNCYGTCQECRAYVAKEGRWAGTEKAETSVPGTFEEMGTLPTEREEKNPADTDLIDAIESGKSTAEIIRDTPKYAFHSNDIDTLRETLTLEHFRAGYRELQVNYLYGSTATGKTRSIYSTHEPREICRVTNYGGNSGVKFDAYHGHSVLVFEEFHAQIPLPDMLNYLDGYPLMLPARYSDRIACYTTVYITSNVPPSALYRVEQRTDPATWEAFLRRFTRVIEFHTDGSTEEHNKEEYI